MASKGGWVMFAAVVLWYALTAKKRPAPGKSAELSSSPQSLIDKECPMSIHSTEDFWVAMPCYDDLPGLRRALRSVMEQQETGYRNVRVVVFEDNSNNMISQEEIDAYRDRMNVTFLRNPTPPNQGSAFGKAKLFDYLRKNTPPNEYILVLDGDDLLPDEWTIHDIGISLRRRKPWFAWGRQNGMFSTSCTKVESDTDLSLRYIKWSFCHPRVFKAHLLNHIGDRQFQRKDGQWLQKATDAAFIYEFMELAGPERVMFMHERPLYNYSYGHQNGLKVFTKRKILIDKRNVQTFRPAPRLKHDIHVLCLLQKKTNADKVLKGLAGSRLKKDQQLHIHLWSNATTSKNLKDIASRIQKQFPDVSIGASKTGSSQLLGWTSFPLSIMSHEPVDYFIILDDDQVVSERTIAKLYGWRRPCSLTMLKKKGNGHLEEVSGPDRGRDPDLPAYHCGHFGNCAPARSQKAGLSIVDASIFNCRELFKPRDDCGALMKKMWLFHMVRLHKWEINEVDTL